MAELGHLKALDNHSSSAMFTHLLLVISEHGHLGTWRSDYCIGRTFSCAKKQQAVKKGIICIYETPQRLSLSTTLSKVIENSMKPLYIPKAISASSLIHKAMPCLTS